jgi:hypothetical protein
MRHRTGCGIDLLLVGCPTCMAGWPDILASLAAVRGNPQPVHTTISGVLQIESEQFARMVPTDDVLEGLDAWLARRVPIYAGR